VGDASGRWGAACGQDGEWGWHPMTGVSRHLTWSERCSGVRGRGRHRERLGHDVRTVGAGSGHVQNVVGMLALRTRVRVEGDFSQVGRTITMPSRTGELKWARFPIQKVFQLFQYIPMFQLENANT
jgi:hypothetical protein